VHTLSTGLHSWGRLRRSCPGRFSLVELALVSVAGSSESPVPAAGSVDSGANPRRYSAAGRPPLADHCDLDHTRHRCPIGLAGHRSGLAARVGRPVRWRRPGPAARPPAPRRRAARKNTRCERPGASRVAGPGHVGIRCWPLLRVRPVGRGRCRGRLWIRGRGRGRRPGGRQPPSAVPSLRVTWSPATEVVSCPPDAGHRPPCAPNAGGPRP
jgi:hypothetical protein